MIHFILTRFNLKLWPKDKNGCPVDRGSWLSERMGLFETYCYPSVCRQSCKDFRWILMLDDTTPDEVTGRLAELGERCPQMEICKVKVQYSRHFAELFRQFVERSGALSGKVLTTYLDNDDAISYDFVEKVQAAAEGCAGRTVLSFADGFQYFTTLRIATAVPYPNNHFITLVEDADDVRTVYGLGSHYYLNGRDDLDFRMLDGRCWVEVVHSDNVDNDVKMTLRTRLVKDTERFVETFGSGFSFASGLRRIFVLKWGPRALRQFFIRAGYKIKPRNWWEE